MGLGCGFLAGCWLGRRVRLCCAHLLQVHASLDKQKELKLQPRPPWMGHLKNWWDLLNFIVCSDKQVQPVEEVWRSSFLNVAVTIWTIWPAKQDSNLHFCLRFYKILRLYDRYRWSPAMRTEEQNLSHEQWVLYLILLNLIWAVFWNDLSINASVKNIANEPTGLCKVRWNRKRSVINKVPRKWNFWRALLINIV